MTTPPLDFHVDALAADARLGVPKAKLDPIPAKKYIVSDVAGPTPGLRTKIQTWPLWRRENDLRVPFCLDTYGPSIKDAPPPPPSPGGTIVLPAVPPPEPKGLAPKFAHIGNVPLQNVADVGVKEADPDRLLGVAPLVPRELPPDQTSAEWGGLYTVPPTPFDLVTMSVPPGDYPGNRGTIVNAVSQAFAALHRAWYALRDMRDHLWSQEKYYLWKISWSDPDDSLQAHFPNVVPSYVEWLPEDQHEDILEALDDLIPRVAALADAFTWPVADKNQLIPLPTDKIAFQVTDEYPGNGFACVDLAGNRIRPNYSPNPGGADGWSTRIISALRCHPKIGPLFDGKRETRSLSRIVDWVVASGQRDGCLWPVHCSTDPALAGLAMGVPATAAITMDISALPGAQNNVVVAALHETVWNALQFVRHVGAPNVSAVQRAETWFTNPKPVVGLNKAPITYMGEYSDDLLQWMDDVLARMGDWITAPAGANPPLPIPQALTLEAVIDGYLCGTQESIVSVSGYMRVCTQWDILSVEQRVRSLLNGLLRVSIAAFPRPNNVEAVSLDNWADWLVTRQKTLGGCLATPESRRPESAVRQWRNFCSDAYSISSAPGIVGVSSETMRRHFADGYAAAFQMVETSWRFFHRLRALGGPDADGAEGERLRRIMWDGSEAGAQTAALHDELASELGVANLYDAIQSGVVDQTRLRASDVFHLPAVWFGSYTRERFKSVLKAVALGLRRLSQGFFPKGKNGKSNRRPLWIYLEARSNWEAEGANRPNHGPAGSIVVRHFVDDWQTINNRPFRLVYAQLHEPMHALVCDQYWGVNWRDGAFRGWPYDVQRDYAEGTPKNKCYRLENVLRLARNDPTLASMNCETYALWFFEYFRMVDDGIGFCWPRRIPGRQWADDPINVPQLYSCFDAVPGTEMNLDNDIVGVDDTECH